MCWACEEDEYGFDQDDLLDDDEDWSPDDEVVEEIQRIEAAEKLERQKLEAIETAKQEFVCLLLANDEGALAAATEFLESRKQPVPTEAHHTLWSGQETTDGFHVYHVNHGLQSEDVLVSLDSTDMWTYSVKDEATVVVVSPERLWGVDVEVRLK